MFRFFIFISLLNFACEGSDEIFVTPQPDNIVACNEKLIKDGKLYEKSGQQYLWAGQDTTTHFNITDWTLNACYLKKGLGREKFNALITPVYTKLGSDHDHLPDTSRVVILRSGSSIKAYPLGILRTYELVNETANSTPVMIVYCFLADLTSVYTRQYCGRTLTFGVSGYTYADPNNYNGLESFILWDRNSESLWWPINDKGVAGIFRDSDMKKYDRSKWQVVTMKDLRKRYPNALILNDQQKPNNQVSVIPVTQSCK